MDVGIFGAANVTVIPVSLGASEYDVILAGASLPATFDPSGAVREINIEPIVVNQGITVIESTDQGLKGPLQFALGPVVVSAEFIFSAVAPRTEVSGGVGIIVSTSTFTDSEYNVEIPIFVDLASTIIPSDQIATPKFFKTELNLAPQPIVEYTVDIESVFKRLPTLVYGDLVIADYADELVTYFADTSFNDTLYNVGSSVNEYNIEIPSYVDLSMAFYSAIVTMETDIKSVEIDIELLQSVAIATSTQYEIDIVSGEGITKGVFPFKNLPLEAIEFESISEYSSKTFNDNSSVTYPNVRARVDSIVEIDLPPVLLTQPLNVVSSDYFPDIRYIQPQLNLAALDLSQLEVNIETFADATMAFYSNIVTIETDIKSVEIDVELFKSVSASISKKYQIEFKESINLQSSTKPLKYKIDILSPSDRYKDQLIQNFAPQSIAQYDDEIIQDRIALARAGFVGGDRSFFYQDENIRQFANNTILDIQNKKFSDAYATDGIRKNIPIIGTVDTPLAIYQDLSINRLAGEAINTYATNTFSDASSQRPFVVGSNTAFQDDYLVNDYIIIADEKFIVKSISNSEFLEINVSASQNYNDVSAYREIFV